jgi:hypothetical protein
MKTVRLYQRKHGFLAVYFVAAKQMGHREIIREFAGRFNLSLDYATLSRMITKTMVALAADPALKKEYDLFVAKQQRTDGVLFQKGIVNSKEVWLSNYELGRRFLLENNLRNHLARSCETLNRIYRELGNLPPEKWTFKVIRPYLDYLMLKEGKSAAYDHLVIIRKFLPSRFAAGGMKHLERKRFSQRQAEGQTWTGGARRQR